VSFIVRTSAVVVIAGLLSACAAQGPRVAAPAAVTADRVAGVSADARVPEISSRWWGAFNDSQLDALIDEALAQSPNIEIARARLDSASAVLRIASSDRLPQASLDAGATRQRLSASGLYPPPYAGATVNLGQLGVDLSYEIDLVGRVRAEVAAGAAGVAAAQYDLEAARLSLAAAVARTYLDLARHYTVAATLREAFARRNELLQLTDQRARAGLDTVLEVEEARASAASVEADLASNDEEEALLRDELAALVGAGPGRGALLAAPATSSFAAPAIPAVLPADLIGRRADVAAERARVESASAGIKLAEAAFYPNLNLGASLGFQSVNLGSLLGAGARVWSVGPALSLPLFTGGRLRGQLAGRDAEYRSAVARYNETVVGAYREVADAVASLHALEREQAASTAAAAALEHAWQLARDRYRAGLTGYLTVLVAEDKLLAQRRIVVNLDARRADLTVALFRALGGGFTT
jgi:NodT family efflux transporter outer membrane factor (OMF) lipoprotein